MDFGEPTLNKIESYFGKGWTRVLLILIYAAISSVCISLVVSNIILPVYKIWRTPSVQTVMDSIQVAGSSAITTVFLTVLIIYLIIDIPKQNARKEQTEELMRLMRDLKVVDVTDQVQTSTSAVPTTGEGRRGKS